MMKKLLIMFVIFITFSAHAALTDEEVEKFVKTLDWNKAEVTYSELGVKNEVLPNAVRITMSKREIVYWQIQDAKFVCKPEYDEYDKRSLANAYIENTYALAANHQSYSQAFKFTGIVKNIEDRNGLAAVVFDIAKSSGVDASILKQKQLEVANMTRFVCSDMNNDDVWAYNVRRWDSPNHTHWLRYSILGEVVADCQIVAK